MNPKKSTLRHVIIKLSKVKDKENFENSKRKITHYVQGSALKCFSRFLGNIG